MRFDRTQGPLRRYHGRQCDDGHPSVKGPLQLTMVITKLRAVDNRKKAVGSLILCALVSLLLSFVLPAAMAFGIGFFGVSAVSYIITVPNERGRLHWLLYSAALGLLAYILAEEFLKK